MNYPHAAFVTVTILVFLGFFTLIGEQPKNEQPKNLIDNPSLEGNLGGGDLPSEWSNYFQPETGYKAMVVEGGRTGKKSLSIEGKGEYGVVMTNKVDVNREQQYRGRAWVLVEDKDSTAAIKIDYFDEGGQWIGQTWSGRVPPGKDWHLVTVTDRLVDFPQARSLCLTALVGKGKARFDDFHLASSKAPKATGNLLTNGNMEDIVGTNVGAWFSFSSEGGTVSCTSSTDKPRGGERCLLLKSKAEWAGAGVEKLKREAKKTYTLTGFVRVKSGNASIKIDYFRNDKWLGTTESTQVDAGEWQELKVVADPGQFEEATHIVAVVFGLGECEAWFDELILTVK